MGMIMDKRRKRIVTTFVAVIAVLFLIVSLIPIVLVSL